MTIRREKLINTINNPKNLFFLGLDVHSPANPEQKQANALLRILFEKSNSSEKKEK